MYEKQYCILPGLCMVVQWLVCWAEIKRSGVQIPIKVDIFFRLIFHLPYTSQQIHCYDGIEYTDHTLLVGK